MSSSRLTRRRRERKSFHRHQLRLEGLEKRSMLTASDALEEFTFLTDTDVTQSQNDQVVYVSTTDQESVTNAGLLPVDAHELTTLLQDFSALRPGVWGDGSSHSANTILRKPYSVDDWEAYFSNFFENNAFTKNLRDYIGYPVFLWFGSEMQELQEGLVTPLLDIVERSWDSANAAGNMAFVDNATLAEEIDSALYMLSNMSNDGRGLVSPETQARIYTRLADLYSIHSSVLRHSSTLDPVVMPWYATLRARTTQVLASAIPTTTTNRLTASATDKQNFALDVGLSGSQLSLWQDHDVLYLDNKLSSESRYSVVDSFLTQIPKDLQNLMMISVNDFLGNTSALQGREVGFGDVFGAVNNINDGGIRNWFPDDYRTFYSSRFGSNLGWMITHNINDFYITKENSGSQELKSRRSELIDFAGLNSSNYLQSEYTPQHIQNNPQQFLASTSGVWFSNTSLALDLGLSRATQGFFGPLNQFLFFADIFSLGSDETIFYELGTNGQLSSYAVPVSRSSSGAIDGITVNGRQFGFNLDASKNVIGFYEIGANHRPVLDPTPSLEMNWIAANSLMALNIKSTYVGSLIDSGGTLNNFFDADGDSPSIVITEMNLQGGTLYWSYDAWNWHPYELVGDASQVLTRDMYLAFEPAADFIGTIPELFTIKACDQRFALNRLSDATDTVSIFVRSNFPVLDVSASPRMKVAYENASVPVGPVGTLVSTILDQNGPLYNYVPSPGGMRSGGSGSFSNYGVYITNWNLQGGALYVSPDDGETWQSVFDFQNPNPYIKTFFPDDPSSNFYYPSNYRLAFVPAADFHGEIDSVFHIRAAELFDDTPAEPHDGLIPPLPGLPYPDPPSYSERTYYLLPSIEVDSVGITVAPVNRRPVLTPSVASQLSPVTEDAGFPVGAVGKLVSSLIDSGGALDNFSDADGDLPGVALVGTSLQGGALYYSIDNGTTWSDVGVVSPTSARLLYADDSTRLYFKPAPDFNGTISDVITYKAWDRTHGFNNGESYATTGGVTVNENGEISSIHLGSPGHDYGVAPNVVITDSSDAGSGASATANLSTGITSYLIGSTGDGYATPPTITTSVPSGPSPSPAVITANIAGPLDVGDNLGNGFNGINLTAPGDGYTEDVQVVLVGGNGQGAAAAVEIDGSVGGVAGAAGGDDGDGSLSIGAYGAYSVVPDPVGPQQWLDTSSQTVILANSDTVDLTPSYGLRSDALQVHSWYKNICFCYLDWACTI